MKYCSALDGVRGIAVILVILFHAKYLRIGWIGVQIFFVLSGYLITSILLENKKTNNVKQYLANFYTRRALRIFPLYYMFIGILFIVNKYHNIYLLDDKLEWLIVYAYNIKRMFMGENISFYYTHLWSLAVEEQFYLIWPLIIYYVSSKYLKYIFLTIIVISPFIRYLIVAIASNYSNNTFWLGSLVYNFTLTQADAFSCGAMLTQLNTKTLSKLRSFFMPLVLAIFCNILLYQSTKLLNGSVKFLPDVSGFSMPTPEGLAKSFYMHVWAYSLINISSMLLIAFAIGNTNNKLLNNKNLIFTGKVSYGLYIYHLPLLAIYAALKLNVHDFEWFTMYCISLILISAISYYILETPFLKLKRRFT